MRFGCVEIVVFVVLDVGGSDVVVSLIVCKVEGGKLLVKDCVVFRTVGVVAVVNALDVGCGFLRPAKRNDMSIHIKLQTIAIRV